MDANIELIAADIDGTLILNWDPKGIDPRVFAAIEALEARGLRFVAASGRQYTNLRRLFAPVADRIAYLCENGALMVDHGEVLFKHVMDRELALEVCHRVMEQPGCDLLVSGERTGYALSSEPEFTDYLRKIVHNHMTAVERPEDIEEPIIKVSYHAEDDVMQATAAEFTALFEGRAKVMTSGATWMDVAPLGLDKGVALVELGRIWGVGTERMMAFGDEMNDVGMLQTVGRPYLMASGNERIAELVPGIERCANVADALEELLAMPERR